MEVFKNKTDFFFNLKIDFYKSEKKLSRVYSDRSELDLSDETIRIHDFYFSQRLC